LKIWSKPVRRGGFSGPFVQITRQDRRKKKCHTPKGRLKKERGKGEKSPERGIFFAKFKKSPGRRGKKGKSAVSAEKYEIDEQRSEKKKTERGAGKSKTLSKT